jgi:hypothetical protein
MLRQIVMGAVAGAAGTAALNMATYLDITTRGREPSGVPAKVAGELAEKAGLSLNGDANAEAKKAESNRLTGAGALMGYAVGLGLGALYGALRSEVEHLPTPVAAAGLSLAAMAGGDGPAIALGATKPGEWSLASWLSDIVPHAIYGIVTAAAFEAFGRDALSFARARGRDQARGAKGRAVHRSWPMASWLDRIAA